MTTRADQSQSISQRQVTRLPLGTYDFIIHYAEMLDEETAEFRHTHPYMELFYIESGELTIRYDNTNDVHLNAGDIVIVSANTPHHVLNIPCEKKRYFILIFELKLIKSHNSPSLPNFREARTLDLILGQIRNNSYTHVSAGWDASELLNQISRETYKKEFGWTMYTNMLYYGFFIQALRHIVTSSYESDQTNDALNLAIEATKYIHAHYAEKISMETLATHLHISQRHANRMFKKMFGITFGKTLRSLRLTYAKNLLATTTLSAEDIAEQVGFNSAQSLRNIFKQYEKITISQYRESVNSISVASTSENEQ